MSAAFKEWAVVVEALGSGAQILILRKGGIAENRGGFALEAKRFWLFPTQFHAQREKTKPAFARFFSAGPAAPDSVTLHYFADVVQHTFLDDWNAVRPLDPHHAWTETAIREKFEWDQPPGLHAFVVRVRRLREPRIVALTPELGGCKSWVDLPGDFPALSTEPVLDDVAFARRRYELGLG